MKELKDFIDFSHDVVSTIVENRAYHNMKHVNHVIREINRLDVDEETYCVLRIAALYHDVVYNPLSKNNKFNSARYLYSVHANFCLSKPPGVNSSDAFKKETKLVNKAIDIIINASQKTPVRKKNMSYDDWRSYSQLADLLSVDFYNANYAIMGSLPDVYDEYASNIMKEYLDAGVSKEDYLAGRIEFLKKMTERFVFFRLSDENDRFDRYRALEENAQINIYGELERLMNG